VGISDGARSMRLGVGDISILDPHRPIDLAWVGGVTLRSVTLDLAAVRRHAEDLTGYPAQRLGLRVDTPIDPAHGRYWSTVAGQAENLLGSNRLMANPLVRAETFRTLASAALASFPNPALDALVDPATRGPGAAEPAVVRRAVEFIDANAHRDIGLAEVAQAVRISPRGLQHAFRRHRDTTPMRYLHRVRMEGAHRDLQAADPTAGDTVAAIAARWGFAHPGRFSVLYRRTYGDPPSRTLRDG
ncbi:MAG: helix-turn-helix transcriptional regulator, partial [Actinomycetota bacterium]|nr:helix-turn-helix transcriptional regulator [Actinomycetota bacterium]